VYLSHNADVYLHKEAATALASVLEDLQALKLGICIYDAYRPWHVTQVFWEATPPEQRHFVANPARGSNHNRGCAVDLTLYSLETGRLLEMPSGYDEFTERAYYNYPSCTEEQAANRKLLNEAMTKHGFTVYEFEWWHYDFKDSTKYPVLNIPFEKLQ